MKKPGVEVAQIIPDAHGWRLYHAGKSQTVATLAEALPLLPPKAALNLALPTSMLLLERLTLPSTDREELSGMVLLQQEKTLPYPIEEVATDFQVLRTGENESTVASLAVHLPALTALCRPLRDQKVLPQKITPFAQHVAAAYPEEETVLAVWAEQEHLIVAICESGKLGWAQTLPTIDAETVSSDLPQLLLAAEMEGVPTTFSRVLLANDLGDLEPALRGVLGIPVLRFAVDTSLPVPDTNLLPPSWSAEAHGYERTERLRQRLMMVAVVYLVLLAGAFVYLAWTKRRVQKVDAQIAQLQPQLTSTQARRQRWETLAPAVDWHRFPVEILYQAWNARPSQDLRITLVNTGLNDFAIEGEAPSAAIAVAYFNKLKDNPELSAFEIQMPNQPAILPNEHAQFRIFGKL